MNKDVILITGASSDIGLEIINNYFDRRSIILATFNKNRIKVKKNNKTQIIKFKLDLSKEVHVVNFLKNLSKKKLIPNKFIHIASNPLKMSSFKDLNWMDYQKNFNIQIKSFFLISKYILPFMKKNKYGKILTILSSVTIGEPPGHMSPYVTSKYALLGLIKSLAAEYSKYRIYNLKLG